jgi:peptidoglycan/xylan/chitin deacetylase (PgdA/CDA1 family)
MADAFRPRRWGTMTGIGLVRRLVTPKVAAISASVLFGASLAMLQAQPAGPRAVFIDVRVNGTDAHVPGPETTVDGVLRATGLTPTPGRLLSAIKHQVLDASFSPPLLHVDGAPATWTTHVGAGASITAAAGTDQTEPVVSERVAVPAGGLPEVERVLWYPGQAGYDETTYGTVSGEVEGRRRTVEPVGPRQELAGVVALTFDDGPDPRWTPQVLQLLSDAGIKATFCMIGFMAERHPDLVRAVRDQGHVLCDHTQHHMLHMDTKPHDVVVAEVDGGYRALTGILGSPPPIYRAPGGFLSPDVISVARGQGMRVLGWAVDPHDYEHPPADVILGRIVPKLRPGSVILLHDGGGDRSQTVAMLKQLIDHVKGMGWSFATPMFGPPPPPAPPAAPAG